MTDLIAMPENYENIRTGIVELLKAARSAAARNINSIMTAAEYQTVLPDEKLIAAELEKSRRELETRKRLSTGVSSQTNQ